MTEKKNFLPPCKEIYPLLLELLIARDEIQRGCTTYIAYTHIADKLRLTADEREYVYSDGRNKWEIRVQAAKERLKKQDFVENVQIGVWKITDVGTEHYRQNY